MLRSDFAPFDVSPNTTSATSRQNMTPSGQVSPIEEFIGFMNQDWPEDNSSAECLAHATTGWEQFFCPDTPKDSRILDISQAEKILDFVAKLLSLTSQPLFNPAVGSDVNLLSRLDPLWPTIWIWTQILHAYYVRCTLPSVHVPINKAHHMALLDVLRYFTWRGIPPPLKTLVDATDATDNIRHMMATLWIQESKDTSGKLGFDGSELLCLRPPAYKADPDVLKCIMESLRHAPAGPAELLFQRKIGRAHV